MPKKISTESRPSSLYDIVELGIYDPVSELRKGGKVKFMKGSVHLKEGARSKQYTFEQIREGKNSGTSAINHLGQIVIHEGFVWEKSLAGGHLIANEESAEPSEVEYWESYFNLDTNTRTYERGFFSPDKNFSERQKAIDEWRSSGRPNLYRKSSLLSSPGIDS
jgi:hypothetical protein